MQIFKRILYTLAVLAMIALGVALFYAKIHLDPSASEDSQESKSMFINDVTTGMDVTKNGDLDVTEEISYDLGSGENWHGLYQDIILPKGVTVKGVRVSRQDGSIVLPLAPGSGIKLGVGGDYGSYGYGVIEDPDTRLRVVWNVNDSGPHKFIVHYIVAGAIKNYRDASVLLWDAWGNGWDTGVATLHAGVRFPGRIKRFYPRAEDLQSRIRDVKVDGRVGTFRVLDLPAHREVQIRAAGQPLTGMPKQNKLILPELKKEQASIDAYNAKRAKRSAELKDQAFWRFLLWPLISALIGLGFVMLCWLWLGRDNTHKISAGGTYQYPPEKIPAPVIAKALGGSETENLVSATLLAFLQRDVFRVLPSVEKKEDVSIRNSVGATTFDPSKVEAYELPIAQLLQSAIDTHPEKSPDFTKLKKYLDASTAETKIAAFDKALKAQYPAFDLKSTYRGRVRRWIIGIVALTIYVLGLVAILAASGGNAAARYEQMQAALFVIGFFPVLLMAAIEGNAFYRLKADQADRVRKWETYQDFFAKMDLSREYPLTVEIWDEALLYAAAFGYAKKVITNMPRTDAAGTRITDTSYSGVGWMAGSTFAASSFGNMTSGISGVTGMASSSSSGGGGFSGGGGGGGGGGGW
jgi:uncharacterized membrane protein YgcG